ncbi:MAG TPA: CpsB/CapC family capsule biosynthesis tyrosine phosphatase [Anaeromyxobacteraceae bacterium]|nr:CpsB/CapC family capsule biosynthesis tyrosine phosphatase [Anaeromyxobacteraceae bacterium]
MGYVDLHCHLLWGVDDGCHAPEDALEAARALSDVGYGDAAPTPHARADFPSRDGDLCRERFDELQSLLQRERVPLQVHRGAENFLDDAFMDRLGRGDPRGFGRSQRYVLLELPFSSAVPKLPDLVFRVKLKGHSPLFAHPERCLEFERPGRAEEVVRLGGALQLDLGALLGRYGRDARRVAERLLDAGLYAVAATDLHGPSEARRWVAEAHRELARRAGDEAAARLLGDNPRRVLLGEELS